MHTLQGKHSIKWQELVSPERETKKFVLLLDNYDGWIRAILKDKVRIRTISSTKETKAIHHFHTKKKVKNFPPILLNFFSHGQFFFFFCVSVRPNFRMYNTKFDYLGLFAYLAPILNTSSSFFVLSNSYFGQSERIPA